MSDMRVADYWESIGNDIIECGLCPHYCNIGENQTGLCGVRKNCDGKLYATGYGAVSSMALDPIEKKPLYMFHSGKKILSIGGYGCNFHCPFCQNYLISKEYGANIRSPRYVLTPEMVKNKALQAMRDGNIGVAYTYNEPFVGFEFLLDCAKEVRKAGMVNVLVTNGYINEAPLAEVLPFIDALNVDIKCWSDSMYEMVGGALGEVVRTVELSAKVCHVEVTTLVIPNENEGDIEDIAWHISRIDPNIPYHLSRFFPRYRYCDKVPTSRETMYELEAVAKRYLKNVFLGNM